MPTYTFSCCERFDRRASFGDETSPCPVCGKPAKRESVYRIGFKGFARTPAEERDWSRDYRAFREASEDIAYHEGVHSRIEGTPVQGPNFFGMAQAKANDLLSKGAKDANDL